MNFGIINQIQLLVQVWRYQYCWEFIYNYSILINNLVGTIQIKVHPTSAPRVPISQFEAISNKKVSGGTRQYDLVFKVGETGFETVTQCSESTQYSICDSTHQKQVRLQLMSWYYQDLVESQYCPKYSKVQHRCANNR